MSLSQLKWTKVLMTLVVFIDFMGLAMVVVLFPHIFLGESTDFFASDWTQQSRLIALGFCLAIYPLGQFFGASVFGKLSDYLGRKKVLLGTILGTFLGFVLSAISVEVGAFWLLFFSRLLAGLCAGNVAIAQASLIDVSTSETKTKHLSLAQMAMGSAYVVGPSLGGVLADPSIVSWFSPSVPFWMFTGILGVLFLLVCTVYQETLKQPEKVARINLLDGFGQFYKALTDKTLGTAFIVWFVFVCGWWLFESFMPTFLYEKFSFDTAHIGYLLSFNGALYAGFQYLVVQKVSHKIKPANMVLYSAVIAGIAIISMAFVPSVIMLYMAMIAFVLSMGFCIPGLITSISGLASEGDQGQVMGMIGSVQALGTVLVMVLAGYLNALNINTTMIGGGVLIIVSWLLFVVFTVKKNSANKTVPTT